MPAERDDLVGATRYGMYEKLVADPEETPRGPWTA